MVRDEVVAKAQPLTPPSPQKGEGFFVPVYRAAVVPITDGPSAM